MSNTKPVKVITARERFVRHTVWHPLNTDPEDPERHGPRFWYPVYDLIAFALGVVALVSGSPLLNTLFPQWFTNVMGIVLIFSSVVCLVGVIFPKLNILELIGKLCIVFMLGGYAGTVAFLSRSDSNTSWFAVIILAMAVWLLGPRVTVLFIQVSHVRAVRKRGTK